MLKSDTSGDAADGRRGDRLLSRIRALVGWDTVAPDPTFELASEFDPEVGRVLAALYADSQGWRHRRVDSVRLESNGQFRWRTSIDCTIQSLKALDYPSTNQRIVPVTFFVKKPLVALDVTGPAGDPLPTLGRDENGELAIRTLTYLLEADLGRALDGPLQEALADIVWGPSEGRGPGDPREVPQGSANADAVGAPEVARRLIDEGTWCNKLVLEKRDREALEDATRMALQDFAAGFQLYVLVPRYLEPRRQVLKISYTTDPSPSFAGSSLRRGILAAAFGFQVAELEIPADGVGEAGSYHFEFHPPLGIECVDVALPGTSTPRAHLARDSSPAHAHRAYGRFAESDQAGPAIVKVVPAWGTAPVVALLVSLVATALLLPLVLWQQARDLLLDSMDNGSASALLLSLPVLGFGYLIGVREDVLSRTLLQPLRRTALIVLLALGLVAALVAVKAGWGVLQWFVWPAASLSGFTLLIISAGYAFRSWRVRDVRGRNYG